ncbi:MAG TPA: hypothetical protein V6C97_34270 [Oculatellaceae cyanobacterium]
MNERYLYQNNCPKVCQVVLAALSITMLQFLYALPSTAQQSTTQQPNRAPAPASAATQRLLYPPAPAEEIALRARANQTRKVLGPTNPESMKALWELNMYYLKVHKFKEAERDLRYMNDAATRNPSGCPVSLSEVQKAYATAINGIRSGVSVSAVPAKPAGTAAGATAVGSVAAGTISSSKTTAPASSAATSTASGGSTTTSASTTPAVTKNGWSIKYTLPVSWKLDQTVPDQFESGSVSGQPQVWYVRSRVFPATGFGNLAQTVDPQPFLGKRVKFTASVRTEDIIKAQLWMRLDDKTAGVMSADNMINRPIVGTTDWNRYECVLDVPRSTVLISCGLIITKGGSAWIKDAFLEEVSPFASTTETQMTGP